MGWAHNKWSRERRHHILWLTYLLPQNDGQMSYTASVQLVSPSQMTSLKFWGTEYFCLWSSPDFALWSTTLLAVGKGAGMSITQQHPAVTPHHHPAKNTDLQPTSCQHTLALCTQLFSKKKIKKRNKNSSKISQQSIQIIIVLNL